ncbi:MAG: sulfite exporter TauE/SafE family protein, partial [Rhodospirillales bacterium]|nr:sulfite exporter TauE/SafE family protein [Rhodospirillales bacterium]
MARVTDGIAIGLIFTLAGLVKGVVGLGLPTIAMGLLGLWLPPLQAASLLLVPSIVTNIVQMAGPGLAGLL